MQRRAYVNALSVTETVAEASDALGISDRTLHRFCSQEGLDAEMLSLMRKRFKLNFKEKRIFKYANGTKKKVNC